MIRFQVTAAQLRDNILVAKSSFFTDAAAILASLPATPSSGDFKSLWSDIKQVYIDLQQSKCCFCEKPLEGRIEQDVEHFRPKAAVTLWKVPARLAQVGITVKGNKSEPGYTHLAYHPFNYAIACKQCNSVLKKNYFPLVGTRKATGKDPTKMKSEKAYLIYPLGDFDEDPEDLITFDGLSPIPKISQGFARFRALVTIELFKLDSVPDRRILFKGRALLIRALFLELDASNRTHDATRKAKHEKAIALLTDNSCPYANCMRSFRRLYDSAPALAEQYADECLNYISSKSLP